ncbi:MAG: phage holin [Clostridium sp.]|uniref:phage holin n=1 Tax=Clostridium sp. TaxID=1506 RepID=UPI0025BDC1A1|nr:phage holin [Clostridium sp.]MCE5221970.1 phage holin [Clostridium sp.]
MLNLDLKARLKNKAFWVAMVSAIALLVQQLGLNIIPSDYTEIVNTILTILTMLGIVIDPSTIGISDQVTTTTTETVQAINSTENETIE